MIYISLSPGKCAHFQIGITVSTSKNPFVSCLKFWLLLALWIGGMCTLATPSAMALTIIRQHIPPREPFEFDGLQVKAGSAPTNTIGEGNLVEIFHAAADIWEQAIKDDHTVTIQYGWSPLPLGGGIHNVRSQSGPPNRVTEAIVYFDNNGSTVWFLDSTPQEHLEYSTLVKCYTDTKKGRVNSGRVLSGDIASPRALDLLTIAKHEIGHALGLSTWNAQWISKNADQGLRLTAPRPYSEFVVPIDTEGHLRLHGALMDPSLLPIQRKLISVIDLLVIAEMGEFSDLNLNPDEYKTGNAHENTGKTETSCLPHPQPHPSSLPGRAQKASPQ
jgi:hypothetical protein